MTMNLRIRFGFSCNMQPTTNTKIRSQSTIMLTRKFSLPVQSTQNAAKTHMTGMYWGLTRRIKKSLKMCRSNR